MDDLIRRQAAIDAVTAWLNKAINPNNRSKYNDGEIAAYETALSELKKIQSAQPEWIPVTDRLPKVDNISKRVLATTSWGLVKEAYYCVDHWSIDGIDYKFTSVIAWMPLPEPWKGEEE